MRLVKLILVLVVLLAIVLVAAGVVYVQNNSDQTGIFLDKKDLKEKTHDVIEKTKETSSKELDRLGKALQKTGDDLKSPPNNPPNNDPNTGNASPRNLQPNPPAEKNNSPDPTAVHP